VLQRELDHLPDLLDRVAQAADVVVGDVRPPRLLRLGVLREQLDLGVRATCTTPRGTVATTISRISWSAKAGCWKKVRKTSSG
jgi:hypothetical protein